MLLQRHDISLFRLVYASTSLLSDEPDLARETLNHDPRHKDLLLLLSEPLAERQFPDWSMAYIGPNQWAKQAAGPPSREPAGARRLLALMVRTLNRG